VPEDIKRQNPALANNQSSTEKLGRDSKKYEYDAFLSYRRRDATRLAQWIRNKLQRFRLPQEILRDLPPEKQEVHRRRPQIWLDTSYEKSSDDFLFKKVFPALDKSARLIVVATPAAFENITGKDGSIQDNWLVREVDRFLGESRADETERPVDVVFGPGVVEGSYPGRLAEKPRWDWIDLRSFNFWRVRTFTETLDNGLAKLVAGLYDVPDRFLPFLRQEERRRRHRAIISIAVLGICVAAITTSIAIWGLIQQKAAVSALKNALESKAHKAHMSVQLATEQLQKNDPENALATALAGVDTSITTGADRAVIEDSTTAVANSIANETFGAILRDHSDAVLKVSLGPHGKSAITVGADDKAILWRGENGHLLRPIRSTKLVGGVFAIAQGQGLIASGSARGQIRFWNSSAPESSPKPFEFGETPTTLTFSENGQLIAASGTAGKLAVWDVAKDRLVWSAPNPVLNVTTISFGATCNCLALGTSAGELLAWSFNRVNPVLVPGASGRVTNGGFGRDGQFYFITDDGRLWVTSAPSWPTPINFGRHDGSVTGFALAPDGKLAATTSMDGLARIWDLTKKIEWKKIKVADGISSSVTFSPEGNAIAMSYSDGTIAIWDIGDAGTDASETLVMRGHASPVLDLSFSPDGNWLASASLDGTARLWQLQTARRPRMNRAHEGPAFHAVSSNGRYLISGGYADRRVRVWTKPNWEADKSILLESKPRAAAISDDGKRAFIGTEGGDLLEWDTSGSTIAPFSHDNGVISAIAISPDGKTLAAIGVRGILRVCSIVPSPPQCAAVSAPGGYGYYVSFSEDGHWVGAASGAEGPSGRALVWDLNAKKSTPLKGHTEGVSSIQFNKSGNRAVTVSWDGTARIWDLPSGNEIVRLVAPGGRMSTAGFSPDGQWVSTTLYDKTLRLWELPKDIDPGRRVTIEAKNSKLISDKIELSQIKFDPDGNILAGSLANGDIHLWHVPDGTLRAVLQGDGSFIRSIHFQPDGRQITAMTHNGRLVSWIISPVLGLKDKLLLLVARSMVPLRGSIAGKLEESSATRSVTAEVCGLVLGHNLGLPPHKLSGAARARQQVSIPDSCSSHSTGKDSLLEGLRAEKEGDYASAREIFMAVSSKGEFSAEIGLGDLSFVDSFSSADKEDAFDHYNRAREHGVPHAASRLGWLLLADGAEEAAIQAEEYFTESSKEGDADGFAGLAWIHERLGKSADDLEEAFSNYIRAQYAYEQDGDFAFAQEVAERRAMLARSIPPERLANLFLSTRSSIPSEKIR
jgi:WD40 repeat protein